MRAADETLLRGYAAFVLRAHSSELSQQFLAALARESNPLAPVYATMSPSHLARTLHEVVERLASGGNGPIEYDGRLGLMPSGMSLRNLLGVFAAQKEAMLQFLPAYTSDVTTARTIVSQAERRIARLQDAEVADRIGEQQASTTRTLATLYAIIRVLVEASTPSEGFSRILAAIGSNLGWELGAVWLVDAEADVLRLTVFWHAAGCDGAEFRDISASKALHPGAGLPSRVWANREPTWILDVTRDESYKRGQTALRQGLRGAFALSVVRGRSLA